MGHWSRRQVIKWTAALPAVLALRAAPVRAAARLPARWKLPPERPVRVIENAWIPMPDGVQLSARLWLPDAPGEPPAPVVLEYIPYRKRDSYRWLDEQWGQTLASRGIAYARVDVRGSGDSEGVITDEYTEHELDDGVQCIDWLSKQPWSNGSVGMRGISWGGINALHIAARHPPALKAIMPMGCTDNRYTDDAHYIGGTLGHTNFQWGVLFKMVMAAPPDPAISGPDWAAKWKARLQATPDILQTWLSHQRLDAYWRRGVVHPDAITTPTYLVSGWQDTYSKPVLRLFEQLKCERKCLIGPWGHTYPWTAQPQGLDWAAEEIRWWEHWLRQVDTGLMREPALLAHMNHAAASQHMPQPVPGRWIEESVWPRRLAQFTLYLDVARTLRPAPGSSRRIVHRGGAVVGLAKPEWLDRPPVEQSRDDARSLTFDTPPLERDIEILGQPKLRVRVRSNRPVAQLAVRVTEVTPAGESWLVTYGLLNLTRRDPDAAPAALVPGKDYDVAVGLFPVAHRFKRGNRLRVSLSDGLWPLAWPAPEVADLTFTLGRHASIEMPERPQESVPVGPRIAEVLTPVPAGAARPRAQLEPVDPGHYRIENDTPAHEYTVQGTGTVVSRRSWETSEIREGDPSSCVWTQRTVTSWKREDWDCAVETSYELRANAREFVLVESVLARAQGETLFERRNQVTVARDLL